MYHIIEIEYTDSEKLGDFCTIDDPQRKPEETVLPSCEAPSGQLPKKCHNLSFEEVEEGPRAIGEHSGGFFTRLVSKCTC